MTELVTCKRCGWKCAADMPEAPWTETDDGRLLKLPLEVATPHPIGTCNSPFFVNQALFWDLDQAAPDLPPLRVFFHELIQIESAQFTLVNNDWVKETEAEPVIATVMADPDWIFPEHFEIYGEEVLKRPFALRLSTLVAEEAWPCMVG
jgi:hypothetical protein